MEDLNMLAADCVVICCCCQCLILQILVFALLKLPSKLMRKTREFAKRKLNRRRMREMSSHKEIIDEIVRIKEEELCFRVEGERERGSADDAGHGCGDCMEEVEKVMMEFYEKGEFAFGSFWGRQSQREREREREGPWGTVSAINDCTTDQNEDDEDDDFVKYQIIEMVGSFGYT